MTEKQDKSGANRTWLLFDAEGKTLGRFASEIAKILRGKHKADYTPNIDSGDGVVIINAEKVVVTGNKRAQKEYFHHTGHPGGLRATPFEVMLARKPDMILRKAVKGMLPLNKLTRAQMKRLRIFAGSAHDMEAQNPIRVEV